MANILKADRQAQIVSMLVEGSSIRSIERITGVHRDTIIRLLVRAGRHCESIMNDRMIGLQMRSVQIDEIWAFVRKKQKRVQPGDPWDIGDTYTFVAMDPHTKLVPSFLVGKRDQAHTEAFMFDLSARLDGRLQISTDGFGHYPTAIMDAFMDRADAAQLIKNFGGGTTDAQHRYSPPAISSIDKRRVCGYPLEKLICTSHVERQNLTMRMQMRRFTRLTNAFSKKVANHEAMTHLHFAWYNFVRMHRSLETTPAMAAGVASKKWSIQRLVPEMRRSRLLVEE